MSIKVSAPNGSTVEFPDGTDVELNASELFESDSFRYCVFHVRWYQPLSV